MFHPRLVGSGADSIFWQNYIQPLMAEDAPKCVLLDGGEPWHSEALRAIAAAWDACAEELPGYDLRMRENLSQLAFLLCRHRPAERKPLPAKTLRDEARMKRMLGFIQDHYGGEVGAAAIAQSAAVSESECLRCFRATIGVPPTQHLKQFRVPKAAELLASTAWNAAEVGARCSFQDASYFAKTFRQLKGRPPLGIPQGARLRLTGGMPAHSRSETAARSLQTVNSGQLLIAKTLCRRMDRRGGLSPPFRSGPPPAAWCAAGR